MQHTYNFTYLIEGVRWRGGSWREGIGEERRVRMRGVGERRQSGGEGSGRRDDILSWQGRGGGGRKVGFVALGM